MIGASAPLYPNARSEQSIGIDCPDLQQETRRTGEWHVQEWVGILGSLGGRIVFGFRHHPTKFDLHPPAWSHALFSAVLISCWYNLVCYSDGLEALVLLYLSCLPFAAIPGKQQTQLMRTLRWRDALN